MADADDIYTAIAVRKDRIPNPDFLQIETLAIPHVSECGGDGRLVRSGVGVRIDFAGSTVWIASVHMKATCKDDRIEPGTADDCRTQRQQFEALAAWMRSRPDSDAVIVAGDFNRKLLDKADSIRTEVLETARPDVRFLPGRAGRTCWSTYRPDYNALKTEALDKITDMSTSGLSPQIYNPKSNAAIDFFAISGIPSTWKLASDQSEFDGHYRMSDPSSTIRNCDGSIKKIGEDWAWAFAKADPSDHCPILLSIEAGAEE